MIGFQTYFYRNFFREARSRKNYIALHTPCTSPQIETSKFHNLLAPVPSHDLELKYWCIVTPVAKSGKRICLLRGTRGTSEQSHSGTLACMNIATPSGPCCGCVDEVKLCNSMPLLMGKLCIDIARYLPGSWHELQGMHPHSCFQPSQRHTGP